MTPDTVETTASESKYRTVSAVKRHWLTLAFLLGFIVDNITLNRVDQLFDNLLLTSYVLLAMISLFLLYASISQKIDGQLGMYLRRYSPVVVQYAFGGLLSGMLIFYGRSGSWSESWPYLLVILVAIYGNETVRDRASRFIYNIAILFVGMLSYVVLVIPVITGRMGPLVFLGSGLVALAIMYFFIQLLRLSIPRFISLHSKAIIFTLGSIYVGLNFLYFTNIIPPIPLSLKEVGIYHSVIKFENGNYELKYEEGPWWKPFKDSDDVFHAEAGEPIFCFTKVFAPTRLSTDIFHSWEYYDEADGKWVGKSRISYGIVGGGDGGYRGYSQISKYTDGKWRCSVETARGQVIGREEFTIDSTAPAGTLITRIE